MVPLIAKAIAAKLEVLDSDNTPVYEKNLDSFLQQWTTYLQTLDAKMKTCKDKKVVQYHELFNYFLRRYDYKSFGNIEPLPGIAPSSKHTIAIINTIKKNHIKLILQDVYHEKKTAKFIASKTDATVVIVPHDMGADGSTTLEGFYNNIAKQLCR
jgi:zinc/manganese transport system substrate-binding protein